jgi:tRNA (guanine10-N2)-methyltransferase
MPEFLVFFVHRHFEFRYPELEALLAMQGLPMDAAAAEAMAAADPSRSPLLRLSLPTVEHAKFLSERGILVKGVYEVWGHAAATSDYAQLVASVAACASPDKQRIVQDADCSWRISVDAFGKKLSMDEQRARRDKFRDVLPFAGPVQMREPDETFLVLEEFAVDEGDLAPDAVPKQLLFLREIAGSEKNRGRGGARDLVDQQTLKRRAYIGPTSMESEMALLMSNMALVRHHDLVIDPFVGTGSVLIPCATHGAVCYGTDIDIRVLLGTGVGVSGAGAADDAASRVNVLSNFKQYGLPLPELIRADNSLSPLVERCRDLFDAVGCDPPYGIRAGARKSGRKRSKKGDEASAVDKTKLPNYIPPTQPYAAEDVMSDLLEFSARTLRVGGRLVYLLPTTYEYTDADLPRHPRLRVIANSEQKLTTKYARRLITMVKLVADGLDAGQPPTAAAVVADGSASFANLREKIRKRKSPDAAQDEQDS